MDTQENNLHMSEVTEKPEKTHNFNLPKDYLSASSIATAMQCGWKFYYRYIENISTPSSGAATMGKITHKVYEKYYSDKISNPFAVLNGTQMADLSVDILNEELKDTEVAGTEFNKDAIIPTLKNITEGYVNIVGTKTTPKVVETEIRYKSKCGVDILGYIDLIREKNEFEAAVENFQFSEIIADYKITGKKWAAGNLTHSLQFQLYALATGISRVEIHNVVNSPKIISAKEISPEKYLDQQQDVGTGIRLLRESFPTENEYMERVIASVAGSISAGNFMPTDPSNWWCSEKFCGYYHMCRGANHYNQPLLTIC